MLTFIFALATFAVPTVSPEFFHTGQEWIWDYTEAGGALYSTEKYTVIEVQGTQVTLEMATQYKIDEPFKAHHRIRADIAKCLNKYLKKKPWTIRMWHLSDGRWKEVGNSKTLAFEEKFNCNHGRPSATKGELFQFHPKASWFDQTATAAEKQMGDYQMRRRP